MLDIKFIRENPDLVRQAARKKHIDFDVEKLLEVDGRRRESQTLVDALRSELNTTSDEIARLTDKDSKEATIERMRSFKKTIAEKESTLTSLEEEFKALLYQVPNIPDPSVPDGSSEKDNLTVKEWGQKPDFTFPAKDHMELMLALDMVDFERGTKAHGFRGYFLKNEGALLSWAVWHYAQNFFLKRHFNPFIAPAIIRKEHFYGTGHLPGDAEDLFETQDGDYLSGTAEVPMMAYHAGEILKKADLPKRYLAFSPCFRREAGSHGKDIKGLIRVHEFFKLEQLVLCEADHAQSVRIHEELNRNTEEFIESLNIPYRQVAICAGDLKKAHVKSYDTDLWIPSQKTYREIASASYYHDFQTRRFNIRYDDDGQKRFVHSLNATAIPTPRILVALVENNQQEDGSIVIPEALRQFTGFDVVKNK